MPRLLHVCRCALLLLAVPLCAQPEERPAILVTPPATVPSVSASRPPVATSPMRRRVVEKVFASAAPAILSPLRASPRTDEATVVMAPYLVRGRRGVELPPPVPFWRKLYDSGLIYRTGRVDMMLNFFPVGTKAFGETRIATRSEFRINIRF